MKFVMRSCGQQKFQKDNSDNACHSVVKLAFPLQMSQKSLCFLRTFCTCSLLGIFLINLKYVCYCIFFLETLLQLFLMNSSILLPCGLSNRSVFYENYKMKTKKLKPEKFFNVAYHTTFYIQKFMRHEEHHSIFFTPCQPLPTKPSLI